MKRYLIIVLFCATTAAKGASGLPVIDMPAFLMAWTNYFESMKKYESIIRELEATKEWIGNAARMTNISGAAELLNDLANATARPSRQDLAAEANSSYAVDYTDSGLYRAVGQTFHTQAGHQIYRPDAFKPEAALFSAVAAHDTVDKDVTTRRASLRSALRKTVIQLQAATNQVEVLKATGVLVAQQAELQMLDSESAAAANRAILTDIQNRTDREREEKAGHQEAAADFGESLRGLKSNLRPRTDTTTKAP